MSLSKNIDTQCPNCRHIFQTTIWESVLVNQQTDFMHRTLSGNLFEHTCPICGFVFKIESPLLYHDADRKYMIQLQQSDDEDSAHSMFASAYLCSVGYRTRSVRSLAELQEKIAIFNAGRDDLLIEFLKESIVKRTTYNHPDFICKKSIYRRENGKEFIILIGDKKKIKMEFTEGYYQKVKRDYERIANHYPLPFYAEINSSWARNTLERWNSSEEVAKRQAASKKEAINRAQSDKENEEIVWIIIALIVIALLICANL